MSFSEKLKGLVFKKPVSQHSQENSTRLGGNEDNQNPYLTARRTWNEHVGSVISQRQTWQVIGILAIKHGK